MWALEFESPNPKKRSTRYARLFPDDLLDEDSILDWLKRNRYKRVELDWIMYSVMSVALAFLLYSAFLVFGLPPKEAAKKNEDDWGETL